MKKILLSLSVIGAVAAIAVGATTAYFSDTKVSAGNVFAAGKLDLEFGQSETMPFNISDVKPGDSGQNIITLTSVNGGMSGNLNVSLTNFVQYENTLTEPELNPSFGTHDYENGLNAGELDFFLQFAAFVDVNKNETFDTGDIQLTYNGQQRAFPGFWNEDFHYHPLGNMLQPWNNVITMNGGDSVDLVIMWKFPGEEPGGNYSQNIAMTDSMTFDVKTSLEQTQ